MSTYERTGEEQTIRSVSKNGITVTLSDGSRWRINVGDISKTVCWYATQRVTVEECDDGVHPYELHNIIMIRFQMWRELHLHDITGLRYESIGGTLRAGHRSRDQSAPEGSIAARPCLVLNQRRVARSFTGPPSIANDREAVDPA